MNETNITEEVIRNLNKTPSLNVTITNCPTINETIANSVETVQCNSICTIILSILGVTIVIISSIIIISFMIRRKLRKRPASIMICNQACTDLFAALVYIPLNVSHYNGDAQEYLNIYMIYVSLFNLSIICVDRYLATNKPFVHRRLITVDFTKKLVCLVWTAPLVITLIPLTWWFGDVDTKNEATQYYVDIMWSLLLTLVITMTVLYVLATKGAKEVIHKQGSPSLLRTAYARRASVIAKKELRVVHLFGLLLFFFGAAYLPILYINFCLIIRRPDYVPFQMELLSRYFLVANNALNPILCVMLTRDYFFTVKSIIRHAVRTRSGKFFLLVPTSTHFIRRKKLWRKMQSSHLDFVHQISWSKLRESSV